MAEKNRKLMKSIYFLSDGSLRKQNRALKKINQSRIIYPTTNQCDDKLIKCVKNEIEVYELKSKNVTAGVGVNKFKLIM